MSVIPRLINGIGWFQSMFFLIQINRLVVCLSSGANLMTSLTWYYDIKLNFYNKKTLTYILRIIVEYKNCSNEFRLIGIIIIMFIVQVLKRPWNRLFEREDINSLG